MSPNQIHHDEQAGGYGEEHNDAHNDAHTYDDTQFEDDDFAKFIDYDGNSNIDSRLRPTSSTNTQTDPPVLEIPNQHAHVDPRFLTAQSPTRQTPVCPGETSHPHNPQFESQFGTSIQSPDTQFELHQWHDTSLPTPGNFDEQLFSHTHPGPSNYGGMNFSDDMFALGGTDNDAIQRSADHTLGFDSLTTHQDDAQVWQSEDTNVSLYNHGAESQSGPPATLQQMIDAYKAYLDSGDLQQAAIQGQIIFAMMPSQRTPPEHYHQVPQSQNEQISQAQHQQASERAYPRQQQLAAIDNSQNITNDFHYQSSPDASHGPGFAAGRFVPASGTGFGKSTARPAPSEQPGNYPVQAFTARSGNSAVQMSPPPSRMNPPRHPYQTTSGPQVNAPSHIPPVRDVPSLKRARSPSTGPEGREATPGSSKSAKREISAPRQRSTSTGLGTLNQLHGVIPMNRWGKTTKHNWAYGPGHRNEQRGRGPRDMNRNYRATYCCGCKKLNRGWYSEKGDGKKRCNDGKCNHVYGDKDLRKEPETCCNPFLSAPSHYIPRSVDDWEAGEALPTVPDNYDWCDPVSSSDEDDDESDDAADG